MPLNLSIVYDNKPFDGRLVTDWGFSCFVEGLEKSILFDSGADGRILLGNMEKMGIPPARVDVVLLSHEHRDHTGGLKDLLPLNPKIEVWVPHFFSAAFRQTIRTAGAAVVEVKDAGKICDGAHTTGVIEGWIREQSLVLDTEKGLVLVTGCAHPRIVRIIDRVRDLFPKDIAMVLGGFHLAGFEIKDIREIIRKFRDSGIQRAGPAHCSGDEARTLFREEYGDDFVEIGVGRKLET